MLEFLSRESVASNGHYLNGKASFEKKLRWLINNPPDGSVVMQITPAMAETMLVYNDRNRPVSPTRVRKYARFMKSGAWRHTRVPIIFSDKARLIDGQHRLLAAQEAGCSFTTDVTFGADDEAFYAIDVGGTRGAKDIFAINGVQNHTMAAAVTRFVMAYDAERNSGANADGGGWNAPSIEEIYRAYTHMDGVQDSIVVGHRFAKDRLPRPSIAAGAHYICARKSRKQADEYFGKVQSGIGMSSRRDPAFKVRDYLIRPNQILAGREVAAALIQGWNAVRTNKPLGTIDISKIGRAI